MAMKLPTLYSRTSKGQVQVWEIVVTNDSFYTREGILDGKMTESKPTVCVGKNTGKANETSAKEQAILEATAKHVKKQKSGGYWESIDEIDGSKFVEPMLAEKLSEFEHKVAYPCMVDRKYNGGRVVAHHGKVFTRKGEEYKTIPHIVDALAPIFEQFPDIVLDGEGYNHDFRYKLNSLMKILRTTKPEKITPALLAESKSCVRFYVYDGYNFSADCNRITKDTRCEDRRVALTELLRDIPFIVVVPFEVACNRKEIDNIYNSYVADGYEGAMIRTMGSPYVNKRTKDLLKMKPEDDAEAVIVSLNEGTGNAQGIAATATIKWNGIQFDATFKGEVETRRQILNTPKKWLAKEVTFLYNGLTGYGVPNYARIDPDNCFKK